MSLLKNEDLFLVNQNDDTYTVSYGEMKKGKDSTMLKDDDKFLINRTDDVTGDVSIHTVTWGEVQADAGTPPVIDSVTLAEDEPETRNRFTNQSFTTTYVMAEDGKPASTKSMRAWVGGSLTVKELSTDEIVDVSPDGTVLTFSGNKDLSFLEAGDYIEQDNAQPSTTQASELDPADTVGGSITNNGLTFTASTASTYSRSKVVVEDDEKIQFEMTVDNVGSGALIGFSEEGTDGSPGPGIVGAVYDSTGNIRYTGNWSTGPTGTSYTTGDIVGATLNNTTGEITFYKNGIQQPSVFVTPNRPYKLYVHSNLGQVTANFGANGFAYPVDGFSNFERFEPAGVIASIDGLTITMSKVYGDWGPANNGRYAIGPTKQIDAGKQYLKLDQGTLNVIELQSAETPYTPITTAAPKITFGATLGTADTPDDLLPPGTSIQTEIKAANGIEPDSIVESDPVTPISVTGPNATMYGLRFDSSRSTKLSRAGSGTGTISYWKKDTGTNPQWEYVHQTGAAYPADIGAGYDGYMSDYYFVEGQDLPPETFGEDFEGKWGPLDSSKVIANISADLPDPEIEFPSSQYNTDQIWSKNLTATTGYLLDYSPNKAFNGINDSDNCYVLDAGNQSATFTVPEGLSGNMEVYMTGNYFSINGAAPITANNSPDITPIGNISPGDTIEFTRLGTQGLNLFEFVVDGRILVNTPSNFGINGFYLPFNPADGIGHDDSGNNNDFTDVNFQTQPANVYSKNVTYKGDFFAGSAEEIFDGNSTNTKLVITQTDGSGFIKWTGTLENVTSLSVFTERQGYVEVVGNLGTIQQAYSFAGSSAECTITPENLAAVGTTITSISTNWTNHLTVNQVYMYSIKVNGSLLVDEEDAGIDAVKDTPMTSYAVLNTGANGNLEATSATSITYLGEAGTDYYYEEDGAGKIHTGAGAFTSTSGKTYNFGQQPLANPLATDNGDGTITVEDEVIDSGDPAYDERYFWSTYAESSSGMVNAHQAFNGNQANGWSTVDNYDDVLWSPPPVLTGTQMRVRSGQTNMVITLTNTDDEEFNTTIPTSGSTGTLDFTGTIKTVLFSGTPPLWNSAVNWITIDGIILRDPVGKPGGTYGTLYQTWEQWNDYVTLFADNPEHVAKFEAIKAALESYEGDLRQYRGQLLTRLVTSGFTLHEIDSMDLINIEDATEWQANTGYEDGALVTYNDEYWFALSSSYNNSPDDNDPEDWVSLTP